MFSNPFSVCSEKQLKQKGTGQLSTLMIYGWQINAGMNFGYPYDFLRDVVASFNQPIVNEAPNTLHSRPKTLFTKIYYYV